MNKKEQEIINNLLDFYSEAYNSKHLFNKKYFKYSPEEMKNILERDLEIRVQNIEKNVTKEVQVIPEELKILKNDADIANLISNNEPDFFEEYSISELKYIYNILYNTPLRSNIRKKDIIQHINKYFANLERVNSMKI